jgi:hypothetical protein
MTKGPETDRRSGRGLRIGGATAAAALALALAGCTSSAKSSAGPAATTAAASATATSSAASGATTPAPAMTTTSAAAPKTSATPGKPASAPASSAAPKGGAGTNCGLEQATPNPDHLYLVIVSGNVSCAAAQKQMTAYLAYPGKQGSGGFATVNGWSCDHNSLAGFEDDGHYAECNGKDGDIVTQTANAKPLG